MPRPTRSARHWLTPVDTTSVQPAGFSDLESQRVLAVAARAVAQALGREAARAHFADVIGRSKAV